MPTATAAALAFSLWPRGTYSINVSTIARNAGKETDPSFTGLAVSRVLQNRLAIFSAPDGLIVVVFH